MGVDEDEDVGDRLGEGERVFEKRPRVRVCIDDDSQKRRCWIFKIRQSSSLQAQT